MNMKIAILFEGSPKKPGGFYQSLQSLLMLNEIKSDKFKFECITFEKEAFSFLKDKIATKLFKQNIIYKIFNFFSNSIFFNNLIIRYNIKNPFTSFIENNRYDLIIFLSPHRLATYCGKTNFIFNIWDIDHKKNTPYPEHRINYNYRKREDLIDFVLFHAFKIVVPDKKTNRELKKIYNCDEKKLKIQNFIPFIPRLYESDKNIDYQKIFKNFNLENKKYILYPATFWPHKNHQYLIDVAKIFKLNNKKDFIFVLCGSDKGTLKKIKKEINDFKLEYYFRIFEFINDKELISLYLNSSKILMPTDGGPTNLPMFESFYFEKILFYSNHLIDDDELNNLFIGINIREPQDFYNKLYGLSKDTEIKIIKKAKDFYEKKCSSEIFKANYLDMINDFIKIKNW
jgi:glycosyltransferase involved in cell wall biosynthesis